MTFTEFFAQFYKMRENSVPTFNMRQRIVPDLRDRYWVRRNNSNKVVARMPRVPLYAGEAYYLRMILLNEPARSYRDLYGGYNTFKEYAEFSGYVHSPTQNLNALLEAITDTVTSYEFRRMYVMMVFLCGEMYGKWQHKGIRETTCVMTSSLRKEEMKIGMTKSRLRSVSCT